MLKWFRKRLMLYLLKNVFYSITPDDFIDTSKMTHDELMSYAKKAKKVLESPAFIAEIERLRFVQERRLIKEAKTQDDLIFGKAVLYTLDRLRERFELLVAQLESEETKKELLDQLY